MKSITIHGLDEHLAALIEAKAKEEGLSLNKTIKKILEEYLGVKMKDEKQHRRDFEEFCGLWSQTELSQFDEALKDFEKVNEKDWI